MFDLFLFVNFFVLVFFSVPVFLFLRSKNKKAKNCKKKNLLLFFIFFAFFAELAGQFSLWRSDNLELCDVDQSSEAWLAGVRYRDKLISVNGQLTKRRIDLLRGIKPNQINEIVFFDDSRKIRRTAALKLGSPEVSAGQRAELRSGLHRENQISRYLGGMRFFCSAPVSHIQPASFLTIQSYEFQKGSRILSVGPNLTSNSGELKNAIAKIKRGEVYTVRFTKFGRVHTIVLNTNYIETSVEMFSSVLLAALGQADEQFQSQRILTKNGLISVEFNLVDAAIDRSFLLSTIVSLGKKEMNLLNPMQKKIFIENSDLPFAWYELRSKAWQQPGIWLSRYSLGCLVLATLIFFGIVFQAATRHKFNLSFTVKPLYTAFFIHSLCTIGMFFEFFSFQQVYQ